MTFEHSARLRLGILGAGRIVERVHLPLLRELAGEVDVVALADPDAGRARDLARAFGVPRALTTLAELAEARLDAALVAAPNHLHADAGERLLRAGAHVLCEKPLALSPGEARALRHAAERAGRELMAAFPNRFRPEIVALRDAVGRGLLGELVSARVSWLRRDGVPGGWFTRRDLSGGGALTDLGSHLADIAFALAGTRHVVRACAVLDHDLEAAGAAAWYAGGATASEPGDVERGARGFALCSGGFDLALEASWSAAVPSDRTRVELLGTRGSARVDTLFGLSPAGEIAARPLTIWSRELETPLEVAGSLDPLQPYRALWRFFLDGLRGRHTLRPALDEAQAGVELIAALYAAAGHSMPAGDAAHELSAVTA
jgi:oxidoreductase